MRIALIAHDKKKPEMIDFAYENRHFLQKHQLFATGTTGKMVMEKPDCRFTALNRDRWVAIRKLAPKWRKEKLI